MQSDLLNSVPVIVRPGRPAHQQIARWLTASIEQGRLTRGEQLPSERVLAKALGVSRMTLRQALAELERQGVVGRVDGGAGKALLVRGVVDVELTELGGLSDQIMRVDRRAGGQVRSKRTAPGTTQVCSALELAPGSRVHEIVRVRSADDFPIAVEDSFFPADRFADMLEQELDGSMYALLRNRYLASPVSAFETLSPGAATTEEAALLGVARRSPVLRIERLARDVDGHPVEFSRDVFRPDRVRLTVSSSLRSGVGAVEAGIALA